MLADITIGYTAGDGAQWLIVQCRGEQLLRLLGGEISLSKLGDSGRRRRMVNRLLLSLRRKAAAHRTAGVLLHHILAWLGPHFGPKGLENARARLEMKALVTILYLRTGYLRTRRPGRMPRRAPAHVWALAAACGATPRAGEVAVPRKAGSGRRQRT